jgi:hypothetical protein
LSTTRPTSATSFQVGVHPTWRASYSEVIEA